MQKESSISRCFTLAMKCSRERRQAGKIATDVKLCDMVIAIVDVYWLPAWVDCEGHNLTKSAVSDLNMDLITRL
jgi:hypothetical protein